MRRAAALLCAVLAACGGGGADGPGEPAPRTIFDQVQMAEEANPGLTTAVELTLEGLDVASVGASSVEVCADGEWSQQVLQPGRLTLDGSMTAPVLSDDRIEAVAEASGAGTVKIPFTYCRTMADTRVGGTWGLGLRLEVRADCGCTDLLGPAAVTVRWTITAK